MARIDFRFHVTKRVRYAEIDAQRVVFNSRYLEYFDIGITEYWRAAGVYDRWPDHSSPEFHVARAEVDYKVPILLDEEIDIRSEEHTSELQSLMRNSYAVFCLKKKTQTETLHL